LITGYHATLNAAELGSSTTAHVFASFTYKNVERTASQRKVAKGIANFPEVQEVHILGELDILIKVKANNVDSIGKFVGDKLRLVKGIQKTLTCVVFETEKESRSPCDDKGPVAFFSGNLELFEFFHKGA
jgi:DNA-binding Lrp family transcriptional regulator